MTRDNEPQSAGSGDYIFDDVPSADSASDQRNGSPDSGPQGTQNNNRPTPKTRPPLNRGLDTLYQSTASIATNDPRNMFADLTTTEPSRIFAPFVQPPEQSPPNNGGTSGGGGFGTHSGPSPSPNGAQTQRTVDASTEDLNQQFGPLSLREAARRADAAQTGAPLVGEVPPAFGTAVPQQQNGSAAGQETPRFGTAAEPMDQMSGANGGTPHSEQGRPQGGSAPSAQQSPSHAPEPHPGEIPNPQYDARKPTSENASVEEQFGDDPVRRPAGNFGGPPGNFATAPRGHYPNNHILANRHRSQQRNQRFRRSGSRPLSRAGGNGGGGFGGGRRSDGRRNEEGGFGTGANGNAQAFDTHSNAGDAGERRSRRRNKYEPEPVTEQDLYEGHIEPGANFQQYYDVGRGDDIHISSGGPQTRIVETFAEMGLSEQIARNLLKRKYVHPTPIQKCVIPFLMDERFNQLDIMAHAQTGSGKTAAYLLPIIHQADVWKRQQGAAARRNIDPYAIIVFPSRELAVQIREDAMSFNFGNDNVSIQFAIGQTDVQLNRNAIRSRGCDILCATPGRLFQLLEEHVIFPKNVHVLVLDEADMHINNNWFEDLQRLKRDLPPDHRTLLFSATFSDSVQESAILALRDGYFFCRVGTINRTAEGVHQEVEMVDETRKTQRLKEILSGLQPRSVEVSAGGRDVFRIPKMIIFVNSRRVSDRIAEVLKVANYKAEALNGDRDQQQRVKAWKSFKAGDYDIIVATDVCSRGLNIKDLSLVINYDLPFLDYCHQYVHRVGRTGRCGHTGRAVSFFEPDFDHQLAPYLVEQLTAARDDVPEFLQDFANRASDNTAADRYGQGLVANDEGGDTWAADPPAGDQGR